SKIEGTLILANDPTSGPPGGSASGSGGGDAYAERIHKAEKQGLLAFLLLAVGAGFTALLTPCVFPMIPITVSFFTKRKDEARRHRRADTDGPGLYADLLYLHRAVCGNRAGDGRARQLVLSDPGDARLQRRLRAALLPARAVSAVSEPPAQIGIVAGERQGVHGLPGTGGGAEILIERRSRLAARPAHARDLPGAVGHDRRRRGPLSAG